MHTRSRALVYLTFEKSSARLFQCFHARSLLGDRAQADGPTRDSAEALGGAMPHWKRKMTDCAPGIVSATWARVGEPVLRTPPRPS
jgi:hypothetical protein